MNQIKYKPEIDGLRALAVSSVILFHMNTSWLPGGFIGVDIFFVISGYLISTIILQHLHKNTFSLIDFYNRRIRRILPALYVVLIATLVAGYLIMLPKDITYLNRSIKNIMVFWGNIFFAKEGGYFDLKSNEMPLLHMWSLAVEEQFYFIWPAVVLILAKGKKNFLILPLLLMVSSFALSEYFLIKEEYTSLTYYSLATRASELLVGYILAVLMDQKKSLRFSFLDPYVAPAGIFIIGLSFCFLNKGSKFPGVNALYVCMGTAMLIYGLEKNSLCFKVFTSPLLVGIGKISYALYLWHWPILAYMRYVYGSYNLPMGWLVMAVALVGMCSVLSYVFIESKARHLPLNFKSSFFFYYVTPTAVIFLLMVTLNQTSLMMQYPLSNMFTSYGGDELCHGKISDKCIRGDLSKKTTVLVVGDSHAAHYNYFLDELGQKYGWSVKVLTSSSCSPVLNFNERVIPQVNQRACQNLKEYFWQHYTEYETIVFASRWEFHLGLSDLEGTDPEYFQKLEETLRLLSKNVKHVYVFSQVPVLFNNPFRLRKISQLGLPIITHTESHVALANRRVEKLTKKYPNITWVDTNLLFKQFESEFLLDGASVYMDNHHLNQYGARGLATVFAQNKGDLFTHEEK